MQLLEPGLHAIPDFHAEAVQPFLNLVQMDGRIAGSGSEIRLAAHVPLAAYRRRDAVEAAGDGAVVMASTSERSNMAWQQSLQPGLQVTQSGCISPTRANTASASATSASYAVNTGVSSGMMLIIGSIIGKSVKKGRGLLKKSSFLSHKPPPAIADGGISMLSFLQH